MEDVLHQLADAVRREEADAIEADVREMLKAGRPIAGDRTYVRNARLRIAELRGFRIVRPDDTL